MAALSPHVAVQLGKQLHVVFATPTDPGLYLSGKAGSLPSLLAYLARPESAVLDGEAFVGAASQLPAARLVAAAANLVLENTTEQSEGAHRATLTPGRLVGIPAILKHANQPPLFQGAPSMAELVEQATSQEPVFDYASVELFSLHTRSSCIRTGMPPRAAARRGSTVVACVQEQQAWCKFEFDGQTSTGRGRLMHSACSCGYTDYGVLWCSHRRDAAAALAGQGFRLLDLDALEQLLCPLSPSRLAQLLLQLALVTQSTLEFVSALGLQPNTVFLGHLGALPLSIPPAASSGKLASSARAAASTDLRRRMGDFGRQMEAHLGEPGMSMFAAMFNKFTYNVVPLGVLDVHRFTLFPAERGSLADAVAAAVNPVGPLDICHERGYGIDAEDGFPWPAPKVTTDRVGLYPNQPSVVDILPMCSYLRQAGYTDEAMRLLKGFTAYLSVPASWVSEANRTCDGRQLAAELRQAWGECTDEHERQRHFVPGAGNAPIPVSAVWNAGYATTVATLVGPLLGLRLLQQQIGAVEGWAAAYLAHEVYKGKLQQTMPGSWLMHLKASDSDAWETLVVRSIPLWSTWLQRLEQQGIHVREGSLLHLTARQIARELLGEEYLQAQQGYATLIPDLQELVLAEGASLLRERLEDLRTPPWLGDDEQREGIPAHTHNALRNHMKEFLVGQISDGADLNTGGLPRDEQPTDMPPSSSSEPFEWVTVRVRELLASANPRHQAWAGAYLLLVLGSSEQAADQLWRWVCDSNFMDWVAEAYEAQHTSLGGKYLMVRVLEKFSRRAKELYVGRAIHAAGGVDVGSTRLPSRQFVEMAERLSLQMAQYTVAKTEALVSKHMREGTNLAYSHSLRFCLQKLACLTSLVEDVQYWRVRVARSEALQAHPAPGADPSELQEADVMLPGLLGRTAEVCREASKELATQAQPLPGAVDQGQPHRVVRRCRALLAYLVGFGTRETPELDADYVPSLEEQQQPVQGQGSQAQQQQQQQLAVEQQEGQTLPQQQPAPQSVRRGRKQGQQQDGDASGRQAEFGGPADEGPLSADDAEMLLERLGALSGLSDARTALHELVLYTGKGGAALYNYGNVPDLGLKRAKAFCDALQVNAPEAGSLQAALLSAARPLLRLVVASYGEAAAMQKQGLGKGSDLHPHLRQPASTLWTRQELLGVAPGSSYEPPGHSTPEPKPPDMLGAILARLVAVLQAASKNGSGPGAEDRIREAAAMLPLVLEAAEALETAEEDLEAGHPRTVVKDAAELVICLMHKAVNNDTAALQQLAAVPEALRFLLSPKVERFGRRPPTRPGHATGKEHISLYVMQMWAGVAEAAEGAVPPDATAPAAATSSVAMEGIPGASTAHGRAGKRRARSANCSEPQLTAKRLSSFSRNAAGPRGAAALSDEDGGTLERGVREGGGAELVVTAAPLPAGTAADLREQVSPCLLLQAAGMCQRWLVGVQDLLDRPRFMYICNAGHAAVQPGLLAAMRVLQWWADNRQLPVSGADMAKQKPFRMLAAVRVLQWWADNRQLPLPGAALAKEEPCGSLRRMPSDTVEASQLLTTAQVTNSVFPILPQPAGLGLDDVQLAACQLLSTLCQQDPEGLARSQQLPRLYQALAMPTEAPPEASPPGSRTWAVEPEAVSQVLAPAVRTAMVGVEQELRGQLERLSPSWAAVLDAHKASAERVRAPLEPEPESPVARAEEGGGGQMMPGNLFPWEQDPGDLTDGDEGVEDEDDMDEEMDDEELQMQLMEEQWEEQQALLQQHLQGLQHLPVAFPPGVPAHMLGLQPGMPGFMAGLQPGVPGWGPFMGALGEFGVPGAPPGPPPPPL